jgi:hypothetical protein
MIDHATLDPALLDLAALLGEKAATPEAKAALAWAVADALAQTNGAAGSDIDARLMATHLAGDLSGVERDRMLETLAHDPEALAELQSAQALLETVRAAPQPRSAARIAAAQAILEAAQPSQPERVSWLARIGIGPPRRAIPTFAALAVAAVCVIVAAPALLGPKPVRFDASPGVVSAFNSGSNGADGASDAWAGASTDAGHVDGWIAMALSAADQHYGASKGAASELEASQAAVAACRQAGGTDCMISATLQGQCLSTAAASPEPPVTRSGPDAESAAKAALAACRDDICRTVKTLCAMP